MRHDGTPLSTQRAFHLSLRQVRAVTDQQGGKPRIGPWSGWPKEGAFPTDRTEEEVLGSLSYKLR